MFDLSWSELLICLIVAVVVIGPKDLPVAMRSVGRWMATVRRYASDFQRQFQQAVDEAEVDDIAAEIEKARRFDLARAVTTEINHVIEPPVSPAALPGAVSTVAVATVDSDARALDIADVGAQLAQRQEP